MGNQGNGYALVVMNNKDVYYISESDADALETCMNEREQAVFQTRDFRKKMKLRLPVHQISAIVEGGHHA